MEFRRINALPPYAFAQIDADGALIASFASAGTNDVARRRAQLAAASSDAGVEIVRLLLGMKLGAQGETRSGRSSVGFEEGALPRAWAQWPPRERVTGALDSG